MASFDLDSSKDEAANQLKAAKGYRKAKDDIGGLKKSGGDAFQQSKQDAISQLDKLKESITGSTSNIKKYQKQVRSQLQDLLGFAQENAGNGLQTTGFLKKATIQAWRKVRPEIKRLLVQESLNAVGCSQDQTYVSNDVYIKVSSTDLFDLFKESPDSDIGKVSYEKNPVVYPQNRKFSMNRAMLERIQNPSAPFSSVNGSPYKGASGQELFDFSYETTNAAGVTGDFFKVTLKDRTSFVNGNAGITKNKIKDFLQDYYATIDIVDTTNFFKNLMNGLSGCIDIQANISDSKITADKKFALIIQRILGLCFDNRPQIDVAGNAKLAELDGVDENFFEFTEIDLRNIDETINDRRNGVIEFEGCDGIKLPVNYGDIYNGLVGIEGDSTGSISEEQENANIDGLTQIMANNPTWTLLVPTNINISVSLNLNFIVELPKALIFAILTPKVLFPIMVMLKSLGKSIVDTFDDVISFMKNFKKFFFGLVSKIGALFVRELFEIIKKDILILIKSIKGDISKAKVAKKYEIILSLLEILLLISQLVDDWRRCKSVIDSILALLSLSSISLPGGGIPLPLLALAEFRDGFSPERAFIAAIQEMQKVGLPTGPMPDGSPNLGLAMVYSTIVAIDKEQTKNGKTETYVKPLLVAGNQTLPTKVSGVPL